MEKEIISKLLSISLLDGRNRDKLLILRDYFSEFALMKYRLLVEIEYLIFIGSKTSLFKKLSINEEAKLRDIYLNFTPQEAVVVKNIEEKINHDVKAIEYYIAKVLIKLKMTHLIPFVHFGLTSYDINIPAYGRILLDFKTQVVSMYLSKILHSLKLLILKTKSSVMLARTHGQPALPTTMGKELAVFYQRLNREINLLSSLKIEGKLTGAVGNFNALSFVCPDYDWLKLSGEFITSLKLSPNLVTTQILPYDNWLIMFDSVRRINSILLGLAKDIWWYISFGYFVQQNKNSEVGSSTMSHKINPITFENAEGNLQLANSLFEFFSRKLAESRLQRDLSDSTVKRDFGLAFGFSWLAWDSLLSGFTKIAPDDKKMKEDLDSHWEVFSEGVQTYLRQKGFSKAYELLKKETRGKNLNQKEFYELIDSLPVKKADKEKLKIKDLKEYLGLTDKIIKIALDVK